VSKTQSIDRQVARNAEYKEKQSEEIHQSIIRQVSPQLTTRVRFGSKQPVISAFTRFLRNTGLSLFLTQKFELLQGIPRPYTAFTANGWLKGPRVDYVNSTPPYPGNGPGTGCSILFIYYLFSQLGFTNISRIIAAAQGFTNGVLNAPSPLRGVYQNLTADTTDPFLTFKSILCTSFPGQSVITAGNLDNPFPLPSGAELSTVQYLRKNAPGTKKLRQLIISKALGNLRAVLNSDRAASLVK
jgi:hypothetical protein